MLVDLVKSVSRRTLPAGRHFRKLPFGPAAGCVMKLDFHYDLRLYLGFYEIETQRWFKALVRPGYRSFDVGGAGGYDALMLSKLSRGGRVISFECEVQLAAEMKETFSRNGYPIEAVHAFVGGVDNRKEISLDAAAQRYFVPDFIKLDIEGAEADALEGATMIIGQRKPNMIIEVHGEEVENRCLGILRSHGYDPIVVNRRKVIAERRVLAHNRWLICRGA